MDFKEDADIRVNNVQARGIVLKEDKVLVMFRIKNGEEYYVFPGGHMEIGETPKETATREIKEETTIEVNNLELAFEFKNYVKRKKVLEEYYFVGKWKSGEPVLSGEESRRCTNENFYKPMWISINEISGLLLYPAMAKEWVTEYFEEFLKR